MGTKKSVFFLLLQKIFSFQLDIYLTLTPITPWCSSAPYDLAPAIEIGSRESNNFLITFLETFFLRSCFTSRFSLHGLLVNIVIENASFFSKLARGILQKQIFFFQVIWKQSPSRFVFILCYNVFRSRCSWDCDIFVNWERTIGSHCFF